MDYLLFGHDSSRTLREDCCSRFRCDKFWIRSAASDGPTVLSVKTSELKTPPPEPTLEVPHCRHMTTHNGDSVASKTQRVVTRCPLCQRINDGTVVIDNAQTTKPSAPNSVVTRCPLCQRTTASRMSQTTHKRRHRRLNNVVMTECHITRRL